MHSSPLILGNTYVNLSYLDSMWVSFFTPLIKKTRRPERVHLVHKKYSHSSTSTYEEFLQDIIN